jgi:hypothetical protein
LIDIRLSPSRVESYLTCAARWGYAELEGNPEPATEATELGTLVHGLRESYYLHGTPFDTDTCGGFLARAMSPLLPSVLPVGGAVEHELQYEAATGIVLVGRLDLCYPADGRAVVRDYKTTGSMAYAKLERDALFGHSQAPLYALMYMRALKVTQALCGWVYVGTRKTLGPPPWPEPELAPSDHYISHDEAQERVHMRMLPAAREMLALRDAFAAGVTPDDFPKNQTACFKFNRRCPYFARCQKEKHQMSVSAFIAATGGPTAPAPDTAPAAPEPAVSGFLAAVGAKVGAPAPAPVAPPNTGSSLINPAGTPAQSVIAAAVSAVADATSQLVGAPTADAPAINPPEGEGPEIKKGKAKKAAASGDGPRLTAAEMQGIAAALYELVKLEMLRAFGGAK